MLLSTVACVGLPNPCPSTTWHIACVVLPNACPPTPLHHIGMADAIDDETNCGLKLCLTLCLPDCARAFDHGTASAMLGSITDDTRVALPNVGSKAALLYNHTTQPKVSTRRFNLSTTLEVHPAPPALCGTVSPGRTSTSCGTCRVLPAAGDFPAWVPTYWSATANENELFAMVQRLQPRCIRTTDAL